MLARSAEAFRSVETLMSPLNPTHDPSARSWVESANRPDSDFPIQNLPFEIFRRRGTSKGTRGGVAVKSPLFARVSSDIFQIALMRPFLPFLSVFFPLISHMCARKVTR